MTINEKENRTGESSGIPGRRSEGVAGPSREVSKCDPVASGTAGTGQENEELAWMRRNEAASLKPAESHELTWAIVQKTCRQYCTVSIRSRQLKREFREGPAVPAAAGNSGGVA